MLNKRGTVVKWLTFIIFILAIAFVVFLTKNDGSFSAAWQDLISLFR